MSRTPLFRHRQRSHRAASHSILHFAGEHTGRKVQGFMDGGCVTGERAATDIAEARGKKLGSVRLAPHEVLAAS